MSASRRHDRRVFHPDGNLEPWSRALEIRDSWLSQALSTEPADRPAAEAAITRLYELAGAAPPTFSWVASPAAAVALMSPTQALSLGGKLPVEARVATLVTSLRERLDRRIGAWRDRARPVNRPPPDPAGVSLRALLNNGLGPALRRSIRDYVSGAVRGELTTGAGLHWGGQHEAHWVALYDLHRRADGVRFDPADGLELDLWAALARSCGWWWPREGVCVIAERPLVVRTERGDDPYGLVRLHHETGPAMAFPDGWTVHAWHGTRVPSWVIDAPTADLIMAERNVEVRRCAIEHLGWTAFVEEAGLELLDRAGDPGNPGCELRLYDGSTTRLLLVVNGSVERDGTRRQYGLRVPAEIDHPLDAAGWTYGLTGAQYAQLRRRT
ncbi:DUF6745 domain-containing protein [Amycolatopsis sp. NPDC048633]|uniref:DUF6745 domain-containing protein n=1 Tax=Amycolatopsis sp. NPDC048633 TaxID=3157095 RepID=UPI0033D6B1C7